MTRKAWEPGAVQWIEQHLHLESPEALEQFNAEARRQGWAQRTRYALSTRMTKMRREQGLMKWNSTAWEPEAREWLEGAVGMYSFREVYRQFCCVAGRKKWKKRSKAAVARQLREMGYSVRAVYDNVSAFELANNVGLHRSAVLSWIRRGLPAKRVGQLWAIALDDAADWLFDNPRTAQSCSVEGLEWLMGADRAQEVRAKHWTYERSRTVINLDTSEVYDSDADATRAIGASRGSVRRAISEGHRCGGYWWAYLEDRKEASA